MATNVKNILLEISGKGGDAQRTLERLGEAVRELPDRKTLEVQAETRKAQEDIRAMLARLKQIDRSRATPEVNVAITKAMLELEKMDEELGKIDGRRVRAHLEVEAEREAIRRGLSVAQEAVDRLTAERKVVSLDFDARTRAAEEKVDGLAQRLDELNRTQRVDLSVETTKLQARLAEARAALEKIGETAGLKRLDAQIEKANNSLDKTLARLDRARDAKNPDAGRIQELEAAVDAARQKVDDLTRRRKQVQIVVTAQTKAAQAKIDSLETDLAELPKRSTIGIDLARDRLTAQLNAARADLEKLTTRRRVVAMEFEAKTERAEADIARLTAAEAALPDSHEIDVRVNQDIIGNLGRINAGIASVIGSLGRAGTAGQQMSSEMSDATFRASLGFLSFGGAIGPVFALIVGLTIVIGTSLVAALAALVSSLAAAAAAVVALGTAFAAALGPIIGLVIAVVGRIAKVVNAMKAQDAAAKALGQKAAEGSDRAAQAAQRQAQAAQGLRDAQERLRSATVAAYREMEDAAEAYSDAVRGIVDAELNLDSARLSIREAEAALQDYMDTLGNVARLSDDFKKFTDVSFDFDTGALAGALKGVSFGGDDAENSALRLERLILNVREARQREKEAVDGVSDAERNRSRTLQTHNAFVRDGIAASAGYQAALRGVRDAQQQVNNAIKAQEPAVEASTAKAISLIGELTEKEKELLATLRKVRGELRGAFRGATDAVFGGMIRSLQRIPQFINPLRGAFTRLGQSIGASLDIFSRELIRPEWISAIRKFIDAGGRIARVFTADILIPFLRIVRDLALAAMPFLERGLRAAGRALQRLSRQAGPEQLRDVVAEIVSHLKSWLALAYQLGRVFIGVVRGASGEGQTLVGDLTRKLREFGDELNSVSGQRKLRDFFRRMIPQAKEFVKTVFELTAAFVRFANNAAPAVTTLFGALNRLFKLVNSVGAGQGALPMFLDAIGRLRDTSGPDRAKEALERLADAEDRLRDSHRDLDDAQRDLTDALREGRRELEDMEAAASGAKLSTRRARLDVRDAKARLAQLRAEGASAGEIERAEIDLADARMRVTQAVRDEKRAVDDNNRAQAAGVKGTDIYKSAAERLQDSMKESTDALRDFVEAQREAANPPEQDLSVWDRVRNRVSSVANGIGGAFAGAWRRVTSGASTAFADLRGIVGRALGGIPGIILQRGPELFRAAYSWANNIAGGVRDRAASIRSAVGGAITGAIAHVRSFLGDALDVGTRLGENIAKGIGAGLSAVAGFGRDVINALITVFNNGMRSINRAIPDKVKLRGLPDINLPDNPMPDDIPKLATGGMTTGVTTAVIGDNPGGREAVLPLTRRVMRQLARAITAQMSSFTMAPAMATSGRAYGVATTPAAAGRPGLYVDKFEARIDAPAGSYPDARTTMTHIEGLVARLGGDPNI